MFKISLLGLGLLVVFLGFLIVWMAGGVQTVSRVTSHAKKLASLTSGEATQTSTLTVMTWNIAWAYGQGSEGTGPLKSPEKMQANLDNIADTIKSASPDVVLLQEIDFKSHRSNKINQASYLAEKAGYPYVMEAISWTANYLPFPYWPPSEHWKSMSSGGAILSRFPLEKCQVELLPKPESQNFAYSMFYLFRYLQSCELRWGGENIVLFNTHLEAFDPINRQKQMQIVVKRIQAYSAGIKVFGGDFNTVPGNASVRHNYPDEPQTDHRNDETLGFLIEGTGLRDTGTLNPPEHEEQLFTFPALKPNRKLDFIFVNERLKCTKLWALKSAEAASDHLPLVATLQLER